MSDAYQLRNVVYRLGGFTLDLPELTIKQRQITALIGPNGCGKSTLLHLLAFLNPPCGGEIRFFGEPAEPSKATAFRRRIGLLPQKPYLLRGSVLDNLYLSLKLHNVAKNRWRAIAMQVLESLQIAHCAGQAAKRLSGGETQKAALARLLVCDPEILLLDEPFSYLDEASQQHLQDFIENYAKDAKKTLLFSTHNRLQGLALADNVIALVDGRQVKSPLINLFAGEIKEHRFHTGKLAITLPLDIAAGKHLSIAPEEIVLSGQALQSSMRNHFQGRVITIADEMGRVRIAVDAGENFQALITYAALQELNLTLGDTVWVNFKSNAVVVF